MRRLLQLIVACVFGPILASGVEPLAMTEARKALQEGIPEVAMQKLRELLADSATAREVKGPAAGLLVSALIAGGRPTEAVAVLDARGGEIADGDLLRAHAAAASGQWSEALSLYRAANGKGSKAAATLGEAESLAALRQPKEAAAALDKAVASKRGGPMLTLRLAELCLQIQQIGRARQLLASVRPGTPQETKWHRYVEARLGLADAQSIPSAEAARATFEELLRNKNHLTEELLFGSTLGLSEARVRLSGYDAGTQVLENFIRTHPESRFTEEAFKRLDQIYAQQEEPRDSELRKWVQRLPRKAAELAAFYVVRSLLRERRYSRAEKQLNELLKTFPDHPYICEVHLMFADVHLAQGKFPLAVQSLETAMRSATDPQQRGEVELRTAIVSYQQGEYLLAANMFASAGERSPVLKTVAAYDAALAWLHQRNFERFSQHLATLASTPDGEALQPELLLEKGLTEAREGNVSAEESLLFFVRQHPRHKRAGEARLALAELKFQEVKAMANPRQRTAALAQANQFLQVSNTLGRTPEMTIQAEYMAIFLADAEEARDHRKVVQLAEEFVRERKGSPQIPEVRMKLGEVYFRLEDYANAETQFGLLAEDAPTSPYAETALFLAGQSAMKLAMNPKALDRAFGYFERVAKLDGTLKLYARQEQAAAKSREGTEEQAIALYDVILEAQPDSELRFAALCGKADNLAALGRKDRAKLEFAITILDQVGTAPNVTPPWRNQALYKKGKALEQLGRKQESLTAYYDVLEKSSSEEREHFWSSKAGFDAAALMESQKQWRAAIAIYAKLATLKGPRADDAEARVRQIRLEHFVWE